MTGRRGRLVAMSKLHLTAQIWQEGDAYVVHCPELDLTSSPA
jgi:hypothetical protein